MITYDYSGYGKSEGKPSEKEIYSDIEEVGNFCKKDLGISPKDMILLGHSLGSAPTVHLAITKEFSDLKAIILLSPIASGIKLVSPDIDMKDLEKIDVFCNLKKVIDIHCPIFIIHGMKDEVIPFQQSVEMSKFMKNAYEWHPRNGDHSNILSKYRTKFFQKCKFFFEYLNFYFVRKQQLNASSITYNCSNNDNLFGHYFAKEGMRVEENYINENGQVQALSMKDREKLFILNASVKNSFCSNSGLYNKNTIKNCNNSLANECPFENIENNGEDMYLSSNGNNSFELNDGRCSKTSVSKDCNKNLEEEYIKYFKNSNGNKLNI